MTRDEWSLDHSQCMVPGCLAVWHLETHEIPRGVFRQDALKCPAAWLRVCKFHHEQMGDYSIWPIARQLAVKKLGDLPNYSRELVNQLRGRQSDAITEAEVDDFVRLMTQ